MSENLAKARRGDEPGAMEARVAVLEHIATETKDTLKEIKAVLVRLEERHRVDYRQLEDHLRSDFRLLLSAGAAATMALAALMAQGFHWL